MGVVYSERKYLFPIGSIAANFKGCQLWCGAILAGGGIKEERCRLRSERLDPPGVLLLADSPALGGYIILLISTVESIDCDTVEIIWFTDSSLG